MHFRKNFCLFWLVFLKCIFLIAQPTITSFSPSSGSVGSLVTITGTNLTNPTSIIIGGAEAIPISNTGNSLVAMVMPGATTGQISITTSGGSVTGIGNYSVTPSKIPNTQQGDRLVNPNVIGQAEQGYAVAISADGNTVVVTGPKDVNGGAAWVYERNNSIWSSRNIKFEGSAVGGVLGSSVAISADGATIAIGGAGSDNARGAVWIFTKEDSAHQGIKLVGIGSVGPSQQGSSVAISADGSTVVIGGPKDDNGIGASWIFTRNNGIWTQVGNKLIGSGGVGTANQGTSVGISSDANTIIVGGQGDNDGTGAAWIFVKNNNNWFQQGNKIVGSGNTSLVSLQGSSVSLSADGNTAAIGGWASFEGIGATWIFVRNAGIWTQQGQNIVGDGIVFSPKQGRSVSLSADGNTLIVGGPDDFSGASWIFRRSNGIWTQQGSKIVGNAGQLARQGQGFSVAISADGNTAIVGGPFLERDPSPGAAWVFVNAPSPTIASFSPSEGSVGSLVTITGANLGSPFSVTIGGVPALPIKNNGTSLVAMVMPGATTGQISITTSGGSVTGIGNYSVTPSKLPNGQQGNKLVGVGSIGQSGQGNSVAISADGSTAVVGAPGDNNDIGAAFIYVRRNGVWTQEGNKLVGVGSVGQSRQGSSVAISADGNVVSVGGAGDNNGIGAVWIYIKSNGFWAQQGSKIVGSGAEGQSQQGGSVAISADGKTVVVGGARDNNAIGGAVWVFVRSELNWLQQQNKLTGTGGIGRQTIGDDVNISADGKTIIVGSLSDDNGKGASWVFMQVNGRWAQQGNKLVGSGSVGQSFQGKSLAISADGNTAVVGGWGDNSAVGAVWIFARNNGIWAQQGSKLVGSGVVGQTKLGFSVALSADGNTLIFGGPDDGVSGASWIFRRSNGIWTQQGSKIVGNGGIGKQDQGFSMAISSDGNTAIAGGYFDNQGVGAAWIFVETPMTIWNGTTWSNGMPDSTKDAVIASSNTPANFTSRSLTINNGVSLNVNGISANIYGNITNNGNGISGAGTVHIRSSTVLNGTTITIPANATLQISSGTLNTNSLLRVAPGGRIIGNYRNISGQITLQQAVVAQRGWRMFANPFSTNQVFATVAVNNNITINPNPHPLEGADVRVFENGSNTWTDAITSVQSNQPYRLLIRGLSNEVNGNIYNGGPSAFTYQVTGILNRDTVSIRPNNANNFLVVGNPFAAPIHTQALTGGVSSGYYTFQISEGSDTASKRRTAGSWIVSSRNSNSSNTIPVLGVLAYQPANTNSFNITSQSINISGTLQTGLFNTDTLRQLGLSIEQSGRLVDRLYIRSDQRAPARLRKMENETLNFYVKGVDALRYGIESKLELLNAIIQLGIAAPSGNYSLRVNELNLPSDIEPILVDNFLRTRTVLKENTRYQFEVGTNLSSQGDNRFEVQFKRPGSLAVSGPSQNMVVKVFSQPGRTEGDLHVEISGAENNRAFIRVIDSKGNPIIEQYGTNGMNRITMLSTSGSYVVVVHDGFNRVVQRIFKF